MAWDGSGNFTRSHDWTDDAAASVNIEASRMDTEDDNFSTGIGACLTKNNESKPTAHFSPNAASTYDLGVTGTRWRDLFLSRNADIDGSLDVATNITKGAVSLIVPVARAITQSGATIDISLNYGYKNYRVDIHDLLPSTDDVSLKLRVSTDAGTTFDAGASDYDVNGTAADNLAFAVNSATFMVGNVSTEGAAFSIVVLNASSTARYPRLDVRGLYVSAGGQSLQIDTFGIRKAAQDTNYLRLLCSSGNIANCDYTVFGWN